ncbi:hypothetical protein L3X38_017553 [Prunus dulcis]|uniref:Uncharacterized protein n=1 Tax=Prunus dulcis TaxID=3755 RepID=A0AAD4WA27_PRUDU|nr:hypothetical protein L3X38_017553 [Prunus dulcis]
MRCCSTALEPLIMCGALTCWRFAKSRKVRHTMIHGFPSPTATKTQVIATPLLSAKFKHLVSADIKKIGGMQNIKYILLKSSTKKPKTCDLPCKDVCPKSGLSVEKQRATNIP